MAKKILFSNDDLHWLIWQNKYEELQELLKNEDKVNILLYLGKITHTN